MDMFPKDHDITHGKNLWRFLSRFGIAAGAFVVCIAIATTVAMSLDGLDFVKRMLVAFSPYAESLPWIVCIVSLTLVLCLPGGPTALLGILKSIRKIGPLEFYPSESPEELRLNRMSLELWSETEEKQTGQKTDPNKEIGLGPQKLISRIPVASHGMFRAVSSMLTSEQQQALIQKLQEKKRQKTCILHHHAGRIGATITDRDIRLRQHPLHFDACMKRGEEQILVRTTSIDSPLLYDIVRDFSDIAESLAKSVIEHVSLHLLITIRVKQGETDALTPQVIAEKTKPIRHTFQTGNSFRLYFYSVSDDNAVKPLEETP